MRLQTWLPGEQDSLRELQRTIKRGNAATLLERHTDDTLIQLLRRLILPTRIISWVHIVLLVSVAVFITGMILQVWQIPAYQAASAGPEQLPGG